MNDPTVVQCAVCSNCPTIPTYQYVFTSSSREGTYFGRFKRWRHFLKTIREEAIIISSLIT